MKQPAEIARFERAARRIAILDCIICAVEHGAPSNLLTALRSLMHNNFPIGSSPAEENCAQVGAENYALRAQAEGRAFCNQLRRVAEVAHKEGRLSEEAWTRLQDGRASLRVKGNAHEFGTYYEAVLAVLEMDEACEELAAFFDSNAPPLWDDEARAELNAEQERLNLVINQGGWTRP